MSVRVHVQGQPTSPCRHKLRVSTDKCDVMPRTQNNIMSVKLPDFQTADEITLGKERR